MYRIGMFSKLGMVTIKTLRHYDEMGLLAPAHVNEENGYRYYTTNQLVELYEIIGLRQMGFSIPEILSIVHGRNIEEILEYRKAELTSEKQTIANQLFRLENYIKEKKEGQTMDYQVVIKEIPECVVYSAKYVLPEYSDLAKFMPGLGEKVLKANPNIKCTEPDYCFVMYLDGEYKENNISVEICRAVTSRGKDFGDVVFKDMPAVTVVSILHKGSYSSLRATYTYAVKWIEENGYDIYGIPRESYIDGMWNTDNENKWLTEIQFPVNRK